MKKIVCIILLLALLLLCACNVVTPPSESSKDSESDTPAAPEITPSESSDASPESSKPEESESETPLESSSTPKDTSITLNKEEFCGIEYAYIHIFTRNMEIPSLNALRALFTFRNGLGQIMIISESVLNEVSRYGSKEIDEYLEFCNKVIDGELILCAPEINGKISDGKIFIYTGNGNINEMIFYLEVTENKKRPSCYVTYLDEEEQDLVKGKNIVEAIEAITLKPMFDPDDQYVMKDLALDGKNVSAVIVEGKDRTDLVFIWDYMLVEIIFWDEGIDVENIMKSFSMVPIF